MRSVTPPSSRRWLPLGTACSFLDVNEATLRQWADRGFIRAFRTPGGHRRFLRDDLHALVESASRPREGRGPENLDEEALRRVRRRLGGNRLSGLEWHDSLGDQGRARLRLLGRRLLALTTGGVARRRRRADLLDEARLLGEEHGTEAARRGLPLRQAVEAFVFFRNSTLDALRDALRPTGAQQGDLARASQQVMYVSDAVLVSMTSAYEAERQRSAAPQSGNTPTAEAP